jgi:hypothetical protein
MPKKAGRPPMPKGKSKGVLFAFKISGEEARDINKAVKESGLSRPDWAREALLSRVRPPWIISRHWSAKDLQGRTVDFEFKTADGVYFVKGLGSFWVFRHEDNVQLAIEIHGGPQEKMHRIFLTQEMADAISRHPDASVADFYCHVTVTRLEKRG